MGNFRLYANFTKYFQLYLVICINKLVGYLYLYLSIHVCTQLMRDFRLHLEVDENYALLGYDTENNGNFLPTFRDNLPLKMGPTCGVITQKSAVLIYRVFHA